MSGVQIRAARPNDAAVMALYNVAMAKVSAEQWRMPMMHLRAWCFPCELTRRRESIWPGDSP